MYFVCQFFVGVFSLSNTVQFTVIPVPTAVLNLFTVSSTNLGTSSCPRPSTEACVPPLLLCAKVLSPSLAGTNLVPHVLLKKKKNIPTSNCCLSISFMLSLLLKIIWWYSVPPPITNPSCTDSKLNLVKIRKQRWGKGGWQWAFWFYFTPFILLLCFSVCSCMFVCFV